MIWAKQHLLLLLFCLFPLLVCAAEFTQPKKTIQPKIATIEFAGNEVTQDKVLRREIYIAVGELYDIPRVEKSRQAVMNLGLFASVVIKLENVAEGVAVTFQVEEKRYLLPIPRFSVNRNQDVSYGMKVQWANVSGLNKKLALTLSRKEFNGGQRDNQDSIKIQYLHPALADSAWLLGISARYSNGPVVLDVAEEQRDYTEHGVDFDFMFSKRFADQGANQGLTVGGGAGLWLLERRAGVEQPNIKGGAAPFLAVNLGYKELEFFVHSEQGFRADLEINQSIFGWGDFHFIRYTLQAEQYYPGLGIHHNLVFSVAAGGLNGGPGHFDAYDIGSDILKGYEREAVVGDAFVKMGVEYLAPIFKQSSLRAYTGFELGNVYADWRASNVGKLRPVVSLGLRWRPKWFVGLELDLGVAYAFDQDQWRGEFANRKIR